MKKIFNIDYKKFIKKSVQCEMIAIVSSGISISGFEELPNIPQA